MVIEELHITRDCLLGAYVYERGKPDVYLQYVEHSPDHWYGDTETDIDIDREKAVEIVDFLKKHFKL